VPSVFRALTESGGGYLEYVWPQLRPSVDTAGFLGGALYMADMALDGVEAAYSPSLTPESLRAAGGSDGDLDGVRAALDVFQYVQPQLLLIAAALVEAWDSERVGGGGHAEPRIPTEREQRHAGTRLVLADGDAAPLPEIAAALSVAVAPDLYRAVA